MTDAKKVAAILQKPGPIAIADKKAIEARMGELGGKRPAKRPAKRAPTKKGGRK